MKITPRVVIAFLSFTVGGLALARWSARIGREVWSPSVFGWRNPFKTRPNFREQAGCPVKFIRPRFYSFMSVGSAIGSVLRVDVKNISDKPIHSLTVSYYSTEPTDTGASGWHPETFIEPEHCFTISTSSNGDAEVTFSVDFIQFADGDTWFANPPKEDIKPEGVTAGAQAAAVYLRELLEAEGAAAVMNVLPQIRRKMALWRFSTEEDFSYFNFDYGITNAVVQVEHAYQKNGLPGVEEFLTRRT